MRMPGGAHAPKMVAGLLVSIDAILDKSREGVLMYLYVYFRLQIIC